MTIVMLSAARLGRSHLRACCAKVSAMAARPSTAHIHGCTGACACCAARVAASSASSFHTFANRGLSADASARNRAFGPALFFTRSTSPKFQKITLGRRNASNSSLPPHSIVTMPALSPTMEKGNIGKWKKSVGDKLSPGDIIADVETDKAQMDFEYNSDEGYIAAILVAEGTRDVPVGTPLFVLAEEAGDVAALADYKPLSDSAAGATPPSTASEAAPVFSPAAEPATATTPASVADTTSRDGRIIASPAARVMARSVGFDLSSIPATGPGGRIVLSDVASAKNCAAPKSVSLSSVVSTASASKPADSGLHAYTEIPVTTMRRVIAERLSISKTTIPHYYVTGALRVDRLLHLRKLLNERAAVTSPGAAAVRVSVNDMLVKACALAMRAVPAMNSSWNDGKTIRQYNDVDVCIAVATPTGLLTPAVKRAQAKGLAEISRESKALSDKAKKGSLGGSDLTGTFTISNLGMYGCVSDFSAIINPPQAGILAVSGVEEIVVRGAGYSGSGDVCADTDCADSQSLPKFEVAQQMKVTLSCDHRVVDGAVAAEWMREFKRIIEEPLNLMM